MTDAPRCKKGDTKAADGQTIAHGCIKPEGHHGRCMKRPFRNGTAPAYDGPVIIKGKASLGDDFSELGEDLTTLAEAARSFEETSRDFQATLRRVVGNLKSMARQARLDKIKTRDEIVKLKEQLD